jgi:hypothetical protein
LPSRSAAARIARGRPAAMLISAKPNELAPRSPMGCFLRYGMGFPVGRAERGESCLLLCLIVIPRASPRSSEKVPLDRFAVLGACAVDLALFHPLPSSFSFAPASLPDFAEPPADPSLVDLVLYLPPATEDTSADAPRTPRWDLLASDWPFLAPANSKETPAAPPLTPRAPSAPPFLPQAPLGGGSRGGGGASSNGGGGGAVGGVGGRAANNGVNQALFHAFQAGVGFNQPAVLPSPPGGEGSGALPPSPLGGEGSGVRGEQTPAPTLSAVASSASTTGAPRSQTPLPPGVQTNPSPNSASPTLPNTPGANDTTAGTTTTSTTALGTSSPQMDVAEFASGDPFGVFRRICG